MIFAGKIEWPYSVYVTPASTATSDLYFDLSLLTLFWNKVRSDGGDIRVFAQGASYHLFAPSSVPAGQSPGTYELGTKFSADVAGQVTELRFYQAAGDTGSHVGHLWDGAGNLLATVPFPAATSEGWQSVSLPTPVGISAGTTYTVSYSTDSQVARSDHYFDAQVDNPPLHAPVGAGVYGEAGTFPAAVWLNRNYWADVSFSPGSGGVTPVAREVSGFDYANKLGSLFIATSGATAFYITCGTGAAEPAPDSTYGKYAVWESAAKLVAHGETYTDSTINQVTLTQNSSVLATAKLAKGFSSDGTQSAQIVTNYTGQLGDFTFFVWFKALGHGFSNYERILDKNYCAGIALCRQGSLANTWGCYLLDPSAAVPHMVTLADGAWHLLVVTRSGTALRVDGDGGSVTNSPSVSSNAIDSTALHIGWSTAAMYYNDFNGLIDEPRIYSRALSPTEIATMYANQNAPASFWTIGAGA